MVTIDRNLYAKENGQYNSFLSLIKEAVRQRNDLIVS